MDSRAAEEPADKARATGQASEKPTGTAGRRTGHTANKPTNTATTTKEPSEKWGSGSPGGRATTDRVYYSLLE